MVRVLILCSLLVWTFGCAGSKTSESTPTGPRIIDADREAVVLGETVYFTARDLLRPEDGITRLNFIGTFIGLSGTRTPVDITITPLYDGQDGDLHVLRLSRIGPFAHPFAPGPDAEPGEFRGQVYVVSVPFEGAASVGIAQDFTLKIEPSIAIETWEPVIADCGVPALRGLGGLAYVMKVRAIGFEPVLFRYVLGQTNGEDIVLIEREATGATDMIGTPDAMLMLNDVADTASSYATSWSVEAEDAQGRVYENILPFTVHRPIDHYTDPKLREAEFFEPVPVSSCFRGSLGTDVVYSESMSETRQNSASITVSQTWASARGQTRTDNWRDSVSITNSDARSQTRQVSLTEGDSTTQTYGVTYNRSDANSVQLSSTDGENWTSSFSIGDTVSRSDSGEYETSSALSTRWQAGAEVSGPFRMVGLGASYDYDRTTTTGNRQRVSSTTGSQIRSDRGFSAQSSRSNTRSFGSTTTDSRGGSITGAYALSRAQTTTDSEGRTVTVSEGRTLEFGGTDGTSISITEGQTEAYQRTFTESTTNTTLTSYDGVVPKTKFGIFYRQSVRMVRTTYVRSYNLCGVSSLMGQIQYNEWTWAPDLALADDCPPFPESNLPPAQCLIEPCGDSL